MSTWIGALVLVLLLIGLALMEVVLFKAFGRLLSPAFDKFIRWALRAFPREK